MGFDTPAEQERKYAQKAADVEKLAVTQICLRIYRTLSAIWFELPYLETGMIFAAPHRCNKMRLVSRMLLAAPGGGGGVGGATDVTIAR